MKVSKSSWHYQVHEYVGNVPRGPKYLNPFATGRHKVTVPKSLCPYVWSIVIGLIGTFVFAVAATIVAAGISIPVGVAWSARRLLAASRRIDERIWTHKLVWKRTKEPKPRKVKEKQPSLLAAYWKARKEKVCPPIELID